MTCVASDWLCCECVSGWSHNRDVRQFLDDMQRENLIEPEPHQRDEVSTTDPDAKYFSIGDKAPKLGYFANYLMDNASRVIVGVGGIAASPSQEITRLRC